MAHSALQLASSAVRLARAAIKVLDLRHHKASHPRLGVVDHVSIQPAGPQAALEAAAEVARAIGVFMSPIAVLRDAKPCADQSQRTIGQAMLTAVCIVFG